MRSNSGPSASIDGHHQTRYFEVVELEPDLELEEVLVLELVDLELVVELELEPEPPEAAGALGFGVAGIASSVADCTLIFNDAYVTPGRAAFATVVGSALLAIVLGTR